MKDMFEELIAVKWRGVTFPVAQFTASLEQDLVEHKFVDVDGAHMEATGRAPLIFNARALFRNSVVPGKAEHWGERLYPNGWRAFYAAAADRSVGTLMHPELGPIRCRLRSANTVWTGEIRDGVDVDIVWIETTEDPNDLAKRINAPSPITTAIGGALDLDALVSNDARMIALGLTGPKGEPPTFGDMLNGLQAIVDTSVATQRRTMGMLDAAVYRARSLSDSVTRAAKPTQWPFKRASGKIESAANDARAGRLETKHYVAIYRTPRAMTLASVAAAVHREIGELVRLNPGLVSRPEVPAETSVRYYNDAA